MKSDKDLQKELRSRGSSIPDFARRHGYHCRTVYIVVQRWWHRDDRTPHGGIAREILAALKAEIADGDSHDN